MEHQLCSRHCSRYLKYSSKQDGQKLASFMAKKLGKFILFYDGDGNVFPPRALDLCCLHFKIDPEVEFNLLSTLLLGLKCFKAVLLKSMKHRFLV